MLIAQELNVGFVPVRKPNKLHDTISASYELEYGTDTLEIHTDAIRKAIGYLFMMMSSNWNGQSSMRIGGGGAVKSSS
jgi:hypothetical protein